jgi:hypothetical protein
MDSTILFTLSNDERNRIDIELLCSAVSDYNVRKFNLSKFETIKLKLFEMLTSGDIGFECDILVDFYRNQISGQIEIRSIIPLLYEPIQIANLLYDSVTHGYLVNDDYYLLSSDEEILITYMKINK